MENVYALKQFMIVMKFKQACRACHRLTSSLLLAYFSCCDKPAAPSL